MKRHELITFLGGVAAWPLRASAQQGERMRRIGVLMNQAADNPSCSSTKARKAVGGFSIS